MKVSEGLGEGWLAASLCSSLLFAALHRSELLFGGCKYVAPGTEETAMSVLQGWISTGPGKTIELDSAEVEGHAGSALHDAVRCGQATTYPEGRQGYGGLIGYRFPLDQSAWQVVQGQ